MSQAETLRERIGQGDLLTGVGACNPLEARLIENAGFDFVWSSGFAVSASYALPDASIVSMNELVESTRRICSRVNIPVVSDCDTGFGNANNVIYAVDEFQKAGAAAISIEDKKFPKDTSLLPGGRQELVSIDEFSGKIRAAVDARQESALVVIARTEALIAGWGVEEALSRAHHYSEAGADCILVHSKSNTPDEVVEFVERWDGAAPLVIVPTSYPSLTEEDVRKLGKIQLVVYANHPLRAAVKAQQELLAEMKRAGGIHTIDDLMVSVNRIFDLQGLTRMKENETKYLP